MDLDINAECGPAHAPGFEILVECSSAMRHPLLARRRIALSSHSRLRVPFCLSVISDLRN
jgi:hypothetical protein